MKIIGLHGPKQSGKSSAAKVLLHQGYTEISFAEPLKRMLAVLLHDLGVPTWEIDRMLYEDLKELPLDELGGRTPRHAMQTLGTEWGRTCLGPDFWVNTAEYIMKSVKPSPVVFPDVRFENEADMIRRNGGLIVHIVRPSLVADDGHPSEQGIAVKDPDLIMVNDFDTVEQWQASVDYVLAQTRE